MSLVKNWSVLENWTRIKPLIERALTYGNGEWDAGDLLTLLLREEMRLWSAGDFKAIAVTRVVTYPRKKICDVILVVGDGLKEWGRSQEIEIWAKAQGCQLLRCYGRRGWARAVGWTEKQSIAIKEI